MSSQLPQEGLILCLSLPGEMFALSYIPTEQIDLFKNVNQTKSFLSLKMLPRRVL